MTENQRRAVNRLTEYREAQQNIRAFKLKIEAIETKCNKQTKDPASIIQQKRNRDGTFSPVPVVVQSDPCGNRSEEFLVQLIDMRTEYWQKCVEAEKLCMDIDRQIGERCKGVLGRILSLHYLYGKKLEFIAVSENFSYPHIKRLKWRALEQFGKHEPQ